MAKTMKNKISKRSLRIGDFVVHQDPDAGTKTRGFVTGINTPYTAQGFIEIFSKGSDLLLLCLVSELISRIPREEVKEYWKYL